MRHCSDNKKPVTMRFSLLRYLRVNNVSLETTTGDEWVGTEHLKAWEFYFDDTIESPQIY